MAASPQATASVPGCRRCPCHPRAAGGVMADVTVRLDDSKIRLLVGSPGRGVVPGPVFFRRKDQPCSALTCWKNTLNDVPVLLSAVGNACSVPAPVPVLGAFSGLVVKNDDSVCFVPL